MTKEYKYAVLIDADNTSFEYFKTVFDLITNEGVVTYRRIYGDWTNEKLKNYKQYILDYSLTPVQQFEYTKGKNSTDSAMIIDAMDILYQGNIDGFCIVSSDSDFTKLASRLRESGKDVIGMGRQQTPKSFVDACNEFKYLDLVESEKQAKQTVTSKSSTKKAAAKTTNSESQNLTPREKLQETIKTILEDKADSGWMLASQLGEIVINKHPDFDPKHYGYKRLSDLLAGFGFEIKKEHNPNNTANPNGLEVFVKPPEA